MPAAHLPRLFCARRAFLASAPPAGCCDTSSALSRLLAFLARCLQDTKTWLVNPVLEQGSKGQLIMMFRSAAGTPACRLAAWLAGWLLK